MGQPKALVRAQDGTPWLLRSVEVLREGGCAQVAVVLGARAEEAAELLSAARGDEVSVVRAADWNDGMSASLRAGLRALVDTPATAALVHLVDLPDVGADVVSRVLAVAGDHPGALARATYEGTPGHPVVLGREHWGPILEASEGDHGARDYLVDNPPLCVPCGDLAAGEDVDR